MKNNLIPAFLFLVLLGSCSTGKKTSSSGSSYSRSRAEMPDENSFKLTAISDTDTNGYTAQNSINVGSVKNNSGPVNERRFLNALLGPGGQTLTYNRQGSCCPFKSLNGLMGSGLLDKYEVKYDGLKKPLIIYINMYDAGDLKASKGFTFKQ